MNLKSKICQLFVGLAVFCAAATQSMSYWTFTGIFEESTPRWEAFHGGFGLMNYQDIKKSAYYAYQFLNRLGATELKNSDSSSWVCTDSSGGVQALIWDFTNTFPGTNMINQGFYKRDCHRSTRSRSICRMCQKANI